MATTNRAEDQSGRLDMLVAVRACVERLGRVRADSLATLSLSALVAVVGLSLSGCAGGAKPPAGSTRSLQTRAENASGVAKIIVPRLVGNGGDPGSRIIHQMVPLKGAVPADARVHYANFQEPHMDSCDGMAGTQGWDDAVVQINFAWTGPAQLLASHVESELTKLGWYDPNYSWRWTKRLANGTVADATLEDDKYEGWTLFAEAVPVGKQVSGC